MNLKLIHPERVCLFREIFRIKIVRDGERNLAAFGAAAGRWRHLDGFFGAGGTLVAGAHVVDRDASVSLGGVLERKSRVRMIFLQSISCDGTRRQNTNHQDCES